MKFLNNVWGYFFYKYLLMKHNKKSNISATVHLTRKKLIYSGRYFKGAHFDKRRGGRGGFRPRGGHSSSERGKGWPRSKGNSEAEEEDSPAEEDFREGSLTRAPLQRGRMYPTSPKIKIKTDVIIAIKENTS